MGTTFSLLFSSLLLLTANFQKISIRPCNLNKMAKDEASETESEKTSSRRMDRGVDSEVQNDKLWDSIAKNYEWISHAQISNSFILLMALNQAKNALTAGEISEIIVQNSKGHLYKYPSTLRDALEYRKGL
jgi:hypothetical protein